MALKPHRYNLITSLCLAFAVASAFVFDAAGQLQWLVGCVALVAGTVAAAIYFYNQYHQQPLNKSNQETARAEQPKLFDDVREVVASPETERPSGIGRESSLLYFSYKQIIHHSRPVLDIASIVEIIDKLSAPEKGRHYEFQLTSEGVLNIKPIKLEELLRSRTTMAREIQRAALVSEVERLRALDRGLSEVKVENAFNSWSPAKDSQPN
jgi:hypothetical protein